MTNFWNDNSFNRNEDYERFYSTAIWVRLNNTQACYIIFAKHTY